MKELIPFTEIEVPENWNYNESVKKVRPMVQKWTDMSYEFFTELKIARTALIIPPDKKGRGISPVFTWSKYCEDIGMSRRHAGRLIEEYFYDPFLYNSWNMPKGDDENFFGHFPYRFMRNLLYYQSKENDLVYDPFAGSGVTIDVCTEMNRRCYCSDLFAQRDHIKTWDIAFGLPDDLPQPDLIFLDPPYWKQAEGKYSNDIKDLANVSLNDFYKLIHDFLYEIKRKTTCKIAIVISPTQWPNEDHQYEDHMYRFHEMLCDKYRVAMEYILPYSTQQYNGTQVEIAKEKKICLAINRKLVVWDLKND